MNAAQIVEAVLFASDAPLTADEISRADSQLDEDIVETALEQLQAEYDDAQRSFQLVEMAEGYQILTRPEFAPYLERFDNVPRSTRLSGPSLETLAIIAYRQPLGRLEIEYIRGVGASGVIRTLQERDLIDIVGRGEGLGRPLLYGTTPHFLEHFGFRSLEDLPRPEELPIILRDRIPLDPEGEDGVETEDEQGALALGEGDSGSEDEAPEASDGDDGETGASESGDAAEEESEAETEVDPGTDGEGDGESDGEDGGEEGVATDIVTDDDEDVSDIATEAGPEDEYVPDEATSEVDAASEDEPERPLDPQN